MTHKWGRLATYPKLGDSQLSHREERPHGETPHSMRVYVPSPNCPYPGQVAHATSGVKSGGEGVCGHFGQNGQNSPKKWSLQISYLRIAKERSLGLLHGCKPKLSFPFATRVEVQSTMKAFLTPQSLKHTIYGKKCIYRRYWHEHILGTLRSKNMSKHFWSRPIVGAFKHAHYG